MNGLAISLGTLIFSFIITSLLIVPFINFLYRRRFRRVVQTTTDAFGVRTPIFDKFHNGKAGIPIGGGLLIILVTLVTTMCLLPLIPLVGIELTSVYPLADEVFILLFTLGSFGLLGLYDDIKKFFGVKNSHFFGLKMKHKLLIQVLLATFIATYLHLQLGISILYIPFIGVFQLGWLYVPFAMLVIISFTNAVNITDGLDGLAAGILMISLFGLWYLSAAILDVPLSLLLAVWLGALISFMYFNIYPARIFMGDVGALAFGATLAVIGLLLGKVIALVVIGFIFVVEIGSSTTQLLAKRFLRRKIFPASPLHLWLQHKGWEEPKIVQRAWLVQIMLTIFGVWLSII